MPPCYVLHVFSHLGYLFVFIAAVLSFHVSFCVFPFCFKSFRTTSQNLKTWFHLALTLVCNVQHHTVSTGLLQRCVARCTRQQHSAACPSVFVTLDARLGRYCSRDINALSAREMRCIILRYINFLFYSIQKLQRVQNSAARIDLQAPRQSSPSYCLRDFNDFIRRLVKQRSSETQAEICSWTLKLWTCSSSRLRSGSLHKTAEIYCRRCSGRRTALWRFQACKETTVAHASACHRRLDAFYQITWLGLH